MNQLAIIERLHNLAVINTDSTPLWIINGEAGAGKSFVLRTFARSLMTRLLNDHPGSNVLPFVIPLQQFSGLGPADLWRGISGRWVDWINDLSDTTAFDQNSWLEVRLQKQPTVIILDGVDEFIINNPGIKPVDFREMIRGLRKYYWGKFHVSIALGIRSEAPVFAILKHDADHVLTVSDLDDTDISKHFPVAFEAIQKLRQPQAGQQPGTNPSAFGELGRILSTPLILSALEGVTLDPRELRSVNTRSSVFKLALSAIIKKSRLDDLAKQHNISTSAQDWQDALMLVAMLFSSGHYGQMQRDRILAGIKAAQVRWRNDRSRTVKETLPELSNAFAICVSEQLFTLLFDRTIFYSVGIQAWRFKHRLWQDYLFGTYFALCIRAINLHEITRVAFTAQAFTYGAEILAEGGWRGLDETFANEVIEKMKGPFGQFVIGNTGGLIGNYFLPVTQGAGELLRAHHESMPPSGKLTFIGGVGFRILKNDPNDPSRTILFQNAVPILQACLAAANIPENAGRGTVRILASISWCYLSQFARDFNKPEYAPLSEWPGLDLDSAEEKCILDGLVAELDDQNEFKEPLPAIYKSVQFAYLAIQEDLLDMADTRPISVAHYLYVLALACKHGVAMDDVLHGVGTILSPKSPVGKCLLRSPLPEITNIFQHCQKVFAQRMVKASQSADPNRVP